MAVRILLQLSVVFSVTLAAVIDVCYDAGDIHEGKLSMDGVSVISTNRDTRSKLECATSCYADPQCMTAVFRSEGDCLLIRNYSSSLTYEDHAHSYVVPEEIMAMKSPNFVGIISGQAHCPSECTGYSVCFTDCSGMSGERSTIEPGCMDLTTSQYDTDECGFRPSMQMKEYYLKDLDVLTSTSGHDMFQVTFVKKFDWTTLQVKFRGTLKTAYGFSTGVWGYWRILFNGIDCALPAEIESINYNEESNTEHSRASGIIGICYGLTAGSYAISLRTYAGTSTNFRVGYATNASRLYVEEIGQPTWSSEPPVKPCPSLPSVNFREHSTTGSWSNEPSIALWNIYYTKMEADTWLRINVDMVIRHYAGGSSASMCNTYYILVADKHCEPWRYGKTLANLDYANEVNNEHRSTEFEGHCENVPSGYIKITFYLGTCEWGTGSRDVDTGWNGNTNRIIIQEFKPSSNVVAVMDTDGETMYRVPQFNMIAHGTGHLADDTDEGQISWTIPAYNKIYATSGVSIAMSYDGRVYSGHGNSADFDNCCRYYIKFNGDECTDPGPIEGITALNKNTNLHRPNMIEGICEGIPSGEVTITIWAGKCKGYDKKGDCQFGWNSYQHMLISETFVEREIIEY